MKFRLDGEILRDELGCRQATIEEVELFKQRDELLAALEAVNESAVCFAKNEYSINADAISKVEDAIASVKANTQ